MRIDKSAKNKSIDKNYTHKNENIDVGPHFDTNTLVIDNLDQKLLELLMKGYENKKIATEVKTPLSTIQRRIKKIYVNQYINRKNELNYNKLGFRKGYLHISLKGDNSYKVAQKLAGIKNIISVSQVTGGFDIMGVCIFKDNNDLFNLLEKIKTIERVDKVTWVEEVRNLQLEENTQ
jgi:DNA-binding Lrp family transcriptional regulator